MKFDLNILKKGHTPTNVYTKYQFREHYENLLNCKIKFQSATEELVLESQIERREEENRYFKNSLYLVQWLPGETRNQEVLSLNTWLLDGQLFKLENLLIGTSAERQKINGERPIRMVFYNNVLFL